MVWLNFEQDPEGQVVLLCRFYCVKGTNGEALQIVGSATDITLIHQRIEALQHV